ncbi:molybdate ABC transporter substrate-binding protein [Pelagivirga sediminicola]|uniref:Molybdate ABC transporter substrate-binding protein n=1 Tax=Pelagivirga sediminicola TaxID=2170575 RepID=A0A2T7G7Q1_9RHOB|nr:molybdate ABC transporter substrate-binding protein [Pelagivirga sediminicola]PVA10444.1 molybdate ABC transporter substrate-binding protein [Pelagivirga sediminicola]
MRIKRASDRFFARLRQGGAAGLAALLLLAPGAHAQQAITVFAAASLKNAMDDITAVYPAEVAVSLGGSGTLARQIGEGAPGDVAFLANTDWMDWLEENGTVDPAQRVALVGNALVVIAPADTPDLDGADAGTLLARLAGGRMAIGQTQSVPAGMYGRAWLEAAGMWDALMPHLAETDNVRMALALVARGEAPLGVVYATDAAAEPGVRVVYRVPEGMHDPIIYPVAALSEAGAPFMAFLQGAEAREVFAAHGFVPLTDAP